MMSLYFRIKTTINCCLTIVSFSGPHFRFKTSKKKTGVRETILKISRIKTNINLKNEKYSTDIRFTLYRQYTTHIYFSDNQKTLK